MKKYMVILAFSWILPIIGMNINSSKRLEDFIDADKQLESAIKHNNIELAKEALSKGAHSNGFIGQLSVFGYAILKNSTPLVKLLIERGADVNRAAPNGATPLHYAVSNACSGGNKDIVTLLLEAGADPFVKDTLGKAPFYYSSQTPRVQKIFETYFSHLQKELRKKIGRQNRNELVYTIKARSENQPAKNAISSLPLDIVRSIVGYVYPKERD